MRLEVAKAVGRIVTHVDDGGATAVQLWCALRVTEIDATIHLAAVPVAPFPEQAESPASCRRSRS